MADAQKRRERFWSGWAGFDAAIILFSILFVLALVALLATMFATRVSAERPPSGSKFVLHVRAETCEDAAAAAPNMATRRGGLFDPENAFFEFSSVSCRKSGNSALSVHATDEFVARVDSIYLIPDKSDPASHSIIGRPHPQRVDFDHQWLGTLNLASENATHLPPHAHADLMARISDRQDCDEFRLFPRDCGVEWARADLRTFEAIP